MCKKSVSILDFGAKSNSKELQTKAIQDAIDYCFKNGGGEVTVPKGVFLSGDIRIRSHVTFRLFDGAVILGSKDCNDYYNHLKDTVEPLREDQITNLFIGQSAAFPINYDDLDANPRFHFRRRPASPWNNALIRAIDAHDFKIIGEKGSIIDGNNCYDPNGEEQYRGPHGITIFGCKNFELKGYTIQNTGNWAHNLIKCENVRVDEITANAGHDGFDAFASKNVSIINSKFYTGDDCIAGYGNINVYIKDCVLNSSCSAMRFGGTNVSVKGCYIYGPGKYCFRGSLPLELKKIGAPSDINYGRNNMLSAFTYYTGFSVPVDETPGNITISDCKIENADRFLHYNYSGSEYWQTGYPLTNITFKNVYADNIALPLTAYGDKEEKISLTLKNVNITMRKDVGNIDLIHACNYDTITLNNVDIKGFKGESLISAWSDGSIVTKNVTTDNNCEILKKAEKEFSCEAI